MPGGEIQLLQVSGFYIDNNRLHFSKVCTEDTPRKETIKDTEGGEIF